MSWYSDNERPSRWYMERTGDGDTERVCGTCRYNRRDWTNPKNSDFYCNREDGDFYGDNTSYTDTCDDWESR